MINIVELTKNNETTLEIKGHGIFIYEDGTTKEISIDCIYTVELPEILIGLKYVLNNFEEWKEKVYGKIKEKVEEYKNLRCVEDKYGVIDIYPESPEVGESVMITINDPETYEPIKGVWVWEIKNKKEVDENLKEEILRDLKEMLKEESSESPLLCPLGKTDKNGEVTLLQKTGFLTGGYRVILTKVGDTVYYRVVYVKGWKEKTKEKIKDLIDLEDSNDEHSDDNSAVLIFDAFIDVYPENPKVGEKVTITVTDIGGYPIANAKVYSNGDYIGRTDENGQLTHRYLTSGEHVITVEAFEDNAEYTGETKIYVRKLWG